MYCSVQDLTIKYYLQLHGKFFKAIYFWLLRILSCSSTLNLFIQYYLFILLLGIKKVGHSYAISGDYSFLKANLITKNVRCGSSERKYIIERARRVWARIFIKLRQVSRDGCSENSFVRYLILAMSDIYMVLYFIQVYYVLNEVLGRY